MRACDPRQLDSVALAQRLRELAGEKRNVDVDFLLHLEAFDLEKLAALVEAG